MHKNKSKSAGPRAYSEDWRALGNGPLLSPLHADQEPVAFVGENSVILPLKAARTATHLVGASPDPSQRSELLKGIVGHDHPAVVAVRAVSEQWLEVDLVTGRQLIDLGDVPGWLRIRGEHREAKTKVPEQVDYHTWAGWMRQLSSGLRFLNQNGIAHNDAFPYNVRVNGSTALWIDLADVTDVSQACEIDHLTFVLFTVVGSVLRRADWSPSHIEAALKSLARPGDGQALVALEAALGSNPADIERSDPGKVRDFVATRLATLFGAKAPEMDIRFLRFLGVAACEYFDAFTFGLKSRNELKERLRLERAKAWLEEYERARLTVPKILLQQEHQRAEALRVTLDAVRAEAIRHSNEHAEQLALHYRDSRAREDNLLKQIEAAQVATASLQAENAALREVAQENAMLERRIEELKQDAELAELAASALRSESTALREQAAQQQGMLSRRIEELVREAELARRASADLHVEIDVLRAQGAQSQALLSSRLHELTWKNEALLRSTSWRLTKPLRTGMTVARALVQSPGKAFPRLVNLGRMIRNEGWRVTARRLSERLTSDISNLPASVTQVLPVPNDPTTSEHSPDIMRSPRPYREGLVSIILPVYNQAGFLTNAIDAVQAQTYTNWELIIVNDGSTDHFEQVIGPYIHHPQVRVFGQPNQKLPSALNNGFREARGEFLTWTSADNIMLENQLECLVATLKANRSAGLAYSDYTAIDDEGNELADLAWRHHNRRPGSARLYLPDVVTAQNFHDSGDNFLGASFLWRAEVHDVVGMHDENTFGGEDYDFWVRMNLVTNFVHVAESLYQYRVHDNTLNARAKELKLLQNVQRLLDSDKQRRAMLLQVASHLGPASQLSGYWREASQYKEAVADVVRASYSALVHAPRLDDSSVCVIDIDVSLWEVDTRLISDADILTTSSSLTYVWLRQLERKPSQRVLFMGNNQDSIAVEHAIALRRFERAREAECLFLSQKPRARPFESAMPKHVLFVVGKWRNGGMEQVVVDLVTHLRRIGVRVSLACCDEMPSVQMQAVCEKIQVPAIGIDNSVAYLRDFVRSNGVDLVNYHHACLGAAALAEDKVRTIYTIHNSYVWFPIVELQSWAAELSHMTSFIAVSRQVAEYAHRCLNLPPYRITVIPNGTDLESQAASVVRGKDSTLPAIPNTGYNFLIAATFNRVKCQDRLLRAFSHLVAENSQVHLTVVGEAADLNYFAEVIRLRDELGLAGKVTIIDGTTRANVHSLMQTHDCFVLPSIVEGWSISLAEAALSGMAIIATDVGSARELSQLSEAVIVVRGLAPDLLKLHQAEMLSLLRSEQPEFERELATAMAEAARNKEDLKAKANAAIPRLREALSIEKAMYEFVNTLARK